MKVIVICLLTVSILKICSAKCGFESCPAGDPDMLNVHLICHTHNDVGWLKTVDQYYYGANPAIQRASVQYILDSLIDSLVKNKERKFIYVETAFFMRWWNQQTSFRRRITERLIKSGQLELVSGGWCMNDEGATHYNAIIDQMTLGFTYLKENFGECGIPRIGWQIDPFGHSAELASLFAQMHFDGYFLGRIDYQDKTKRENEKQMEFLWKPSQNLGKEGEIFTSVLPNTYSPPPGFCFDILCDDQPIMDDPNLEGYNVDRRVNDFIGIAVQEAKRYNTNHIAMTMGNDFNYQNAETWFKNLDKLIYHVNNKKNNTNKINVFYSTPSCYLKALNNKNKTWTTKTDDFFPYASDQHAYWTGYFTSRPSVKGYFRQANNIFQVCKQLSVLAKSDGALQINILRRALGVAQHHDAISGTAKQSVTYDYVKRVAEGIDACQHVINTAYSKLLQLNQTFPPEQTFCNYLNISECDVTEKNDLVAVTIYNPIAKVTDSYVRLPVVFSAYKVLNYQGSTVSSQIIPIPKNVLSIPGRKSNATHELVFKAHLPALGYTTYFIKKSSSLSLLKEQQSKEIHSYGSFVSLSNNHFTIFVPSNGKEYSIIKKTDGLTVFYNQSYYYYRGMNGNNTKPEFRASGAYIFRPNGTKPFSINDGVINQTFFRGQVVSEIHQTLSSWLTQVIRLYRDEDYIEFDWVVGPIPIKDKYGKEVITRFDSNLQTDSFYTDANGREIKKRILNYRPTWKLNNSEPVAGNYYPINSRIYIKDETQNIQMTVLTDRSQGGSSLRNGSLELMLHRRLLHDDAFGVGEPLDEPGVDGRGLVVKGSHYLIVSDIKSAAIKHRELAERLFMAPVISFAAIKSEQEYSRDFRTHMSGLYTSLPPNVHLLNLELWNPLSVLIRLEHMYEQDEDPSGRSKPVTVSLDHLFNIFNVTSIRELTLGANQYKDSVQRMKWKTSNSIRSDIEETWWKKLIKGSSSTNITLNPMQIRTFELSVTK